jgi:alkanesulfonate monooxygenase SsuD/methylene tetrahydromethanopterin reductase-like flavin-dependent oxidoreductase (luciferase family)
MKFGIFYELQLPRPWTERSEYRLLQEALAQIELADRLGFDYAWCVEHHFLEEYSHCSAPTMLIRYDVFFWGALMAGALLVGVPAALAFTLVLDRFIQGVTGIADQ